MNIDTSVLLVVDVQNGFLTERTRHVLPVITGLVDQWQRVNGKTVYSRYFNYSGSAFERLVNWRHLYSSPDTDIASELTPYTIGSITLDKYNYSAATPDFIAIASTHNWFDVAICGIDTDQCVLKTALDIFECGLTPWVITNASASTGGEQLHSSALMIIGRAIGERHLITSDELLRRL